jgi:hypothetical protein
MLLQEKRSWRFPLHVPHIHAYEDVNSLPSEAAHFRKGTQL